MDKSKLKALVEGVFRPLRWALQLHDWFMTIEYGCLGGPEGDHFCVQARCEKRVNHLQALITLDANEMNNEKEALGILRHEMLHLFTVEFDHYRELVNESVSEETRRMLDLQFDRASEAVIGRIEAMLDHGLDMAPEKTVVAGIETLRMSALSHSNCADIPETVRSLLFS